jgi:hypothetical protein
VVVAVAQTMVLAFFAAGHGISGVVVVVVD